MIDALRREMRHATRALLEQPGFSVIVIVTLALGIGANVAIFSVVDAVLLEPLPFARPDRLVRVWSAFPDEGIARGTTSPLDLDDWRAQSQSFAAIAGYPALRLSGFVLTGEQEPDEVRTVHVTEEFFDVLGVEAARGRTLQESDHRGGDNRVVVLSDGAWRRRLGSDPDVVGRRLTLNGESFTVVGVMPPGFEYPSADVEMWAPVSLIPDSGIPRLRQVRWLNIVARLADGVTLDAARDEMTAVAGALAGEYPDSNRQLTAVTVAPLREQIVGNVRPAMLTLFAAVGFVLLIGCANVANLVLARAETRQRDIAVRAALGAGRAQLLLHVLSESLLLALAGGLVGIAAAFAGVRALLALAPAEVPRLSAVGIDGGALAFALLLSVVTGTAFGIVPALRGHFGRPGDALREGRGTASRARSAKALIVAEIALVVVLTISAGLMIRTYRELLDVDPGFDPDNLLTMRVSAQASDGYEEFLQQAVERIAALPGVEAAGMVRPLPLRGDTFEGEGLEFRIAGRDVLAGQDEPEAYLRFVGPGYFRAMGIPLLAGRDFDGRDDAEAPNVGIISRSVAERYWPEDSPVGTLILVGDVQVRIVGVVGDVRQTALSADPVPALYVAHRQVSRVGMSFVVRTSVDPAEILGAVQGEIWQLRADQPIEDIATMDEVIRESVAQPRFATALLSLFAGLALVLAAVGVYGVVSYAVGRRRREIGIHMAMGASPGEVLRMVIRGSMAPAALGVGLGLGGAAVATRLMAGMLFGVPAVDPVTFVAVAGILLAISLAASLLPGLRASRLHPTLLLSDE